MTSDAVNIYADLKKDFNEYWQNSLAPFLKEKEQIRKKYVSRFWFLILTAAFVLPVLAIGIYLLNKHFSKDIDSGFFYIICVVCIFIFQTPYRTYKKKIKNDVMQKFVHFFEGFSYVQGQGLSVAEMKNSRILPLADKYAADDCFSGVWQGVPFSVTEQILKRIEYKKNKTEEHTVFQGVVIRFDINKKFEGETVVLKDSGIFNRFKGFAGFERVTLEDPKFEKLFEVYGTNQVETRFLLTPVFMEKLVQLKDLYKGKSIQLSFLGSAVMIAIDTKQDMFEPCSFFKTNLNKAKIDLVFAEFLTIFAVIDLLKIAHKAN